MTPSDIGRIAEWLGIPTEFVGLGIAGVGGIILWIAVRRAGDLGNLLR